MAYLFHNFVLYFMLKHQCEIKLIIKINFKVNENFIYIRFNALEVRAFMSSVNLLYFKIGNISYLSYSVA